MFNRRQFMESAAAVSCANQVLQAAGADTGKLGICTFSCQAHWQAVRKHSRAVTFQDAIGFLLSEINCGTGMLNLPRIISRLRAINPQIAFNLEMATREPLEIPCLTKPYWTTFPQRQASHLEAAMKLVEQHPPQQPPPQLTAWKLRSCWRMNKRTTSHR